MGYRSYVLGMVITIALLVKEVMRYVWLQLQPYGLQKLCVMYGYNYSLMGYKSYVLCMVITIALWAKEWLQVRCNCFTRISDLI
jgi:hypothetical protein